MTAATRRDLLVELLRNLYRVAPRGRTAADLHVLCATQLDCELADVEQVLAYLAAKKYVRAETGGDFAPTRAPYWSLTPGGQARAEQERIV